MKTLIGIILRTASRVLFQLDMLFAVVEKDVVGVQIGGVAAIAKNAVGVQVGGLLVGVEKDVVGVQIGGLSAVVEKAVGVQVGGLLVGAEKAIGVQVGGVAVVAEKAVGLQISGLLAVVEKAVGVQVSGLLAGAKNNVVGVQVSGVAARVEKTVVGVQAGLVAVASILDDALQFGLFCYAREGSGHQFGLLLWGPGDAWYGFSIIYRQIGDKHLFATLRDMCRRLRASWSGKKGQ